MLAAAQALPDWSQGLSPRILLIEDQRDVAANIWDFLDRRGYVLDHAVDGVTGLRLALARPYDVIVLDLGLPRLDGLDLCAELRSAGRTTPVLMLTARDTLDDKLRGFARGADDYVVKPFAMRELEARIRVLLRRDRPGAVNCLRLGELELDPAACQIRLAGRLINLTATQVKLLELLIRRFPAVVGQGELAHVLWGDRPYDAANLYSQVHALRALLGESLGAPSIRAVRGLGYRLDAAAHAR